MHCWAATLTSSAPKSSRSLSEAGKTCWSAYLLLFAVVPVVFVRVLLARRTHVNIIDPSLAFVQWSFVLVHKTATTLPCETTPGVWHCLSRLQAVGDKRFRTKPLKGLRLTFAFVLSEMHLRIVMSLDFRFQTMWLVVQGEQEDVVRFWFPGGFAALLCSDGNFPLASGFNIIT